MMFRIILLSLFGLLLAGCTASDIRNIRILADDPVAAAEQIIEEKGRAYAANPASIPADIRAYRDKLKRFVNLVNDIWGEDKTLESGPKDYVKYTDNYYNRAHINFAAGTVTVETLSPKEQQRYLKQAIVTTLLTPDDPRQVDIYSDITPEATGKPFLYEQVLDQDGKPIQWEWRANRYADYLIKSSLKNVTIGKRKGLRVTFPLIATHNQIRAYKYVNLVKKYSKKYNVNESLIYAIIKTESSFNPFAVSHAPAYGLMQIVPSTAGKDVYAKIKKQSGQPTPDNLYNPDYNIDIGTAYIQLLQTQYLAKVAEQNAKRYTVISAYNGGAGNVLKTFSSNREQAVVMINQLSPTQVFNQLTNNHPKQESRRYLIKVTDAQKEFWRNNGFATPN
ncbi:MAG: membrane-bound lytic murein transglycosylase MltC [Pseudomonadota bacterium]